MKKLITALILLCAVSTSAQNHAQEHETKLPPLAPPVAWSVDSPLGLRTDQPVDTLPDNYAQRFVPSAQTDAYATTGNYGAEGIDMIWMTRPERSTFFFADALKAWTPSLSKMRFYNTRVPMTLLSYNTAGGRDNAQERLSAIFSGNINAKAQVGAYLDYIYSKGCYQNQADKNLIWGFSGSYLGDRYEMQAFFNQYNSLNKENGGLTNTLYITDPALVQGGVTSVDPKTIPVRLSSAHTRVRGRHLWINNRYKVGYWHHETEGDSIVSSTYIPVTSFIYTLDFRDNSHTFRNDAPGEAAGFFDNTYITPGATVDHTSWWQLQNTVGVSLLEGFHKYAKFGLAAYFTHELRHFRQTDYQTEASENLSEWPQGVSIAPTATENHARIGAQLTKQQGAILRYSATGELGIVGAAAGDVRIIGNIDTRIPLRFDSVEVNAFARFTNEKPSYLLRNYLSNHFIWQNDFGKERRLSLGGAVTSRRTGTTASIQVDNVQNHVYFGPVYLPVQYGGSVQIFSLRLQQNIRLGWFNWDNTVTYQTSSDANIIPLPALAVYSNLYFKFNIATLKVQLGLDCDWYTRYYAPKYQPALASFANQNEIKLGNYPFANVYANLKLSKVRFYVMMSHINQGWFSKNYFSVVDYPLNPRRFQIGLCVDFAN
ncbi:MAG: putative porin [Muribaculaceae bacterium]|nr:putative porin [Muribaculaceae bacterium]